MFRVIVVILSAFLSAWAVDIAAKIPHIEMSKAMKIGAHLIVVVMFLLILGGVILVA